MGYTAGSQQEAIQMFWAIDSTLLTLKNQTVITQYQHINYSVVFHCVKPFNVSFNSLLLPLAVRLHGLLKLSPTVSMASTLN